MTSSQRVVVVRRWALVVGLVLGVLAIAYDVWATYDNAQKTQAILTTQHQLAIFTEHAHAQNVRQQNEIIILEKERSQVANEILALQAQSTLLTTQIHAEVPLITTGLNAGQNTLISQYNTIIAKLNSLCVTAGVCGTTAPSPLQSNPLPTSLPNATTGTTTTAVPRPPTTTTTTRPPTTTTTRTKPGKGPH